jgi:hypothetical protein
MLEVFHESVDRWGDCEIPGEPAVEIVAELLAADDPIEDYYRPDGGRGDDKDR